MKIKLAVCFLACIVWVACDRKEQKQDSQLYRVDLSAAMNSDFTELIDSLYYIELETVGEYVIGEISRMFLTDDYIFLVDRQSQSLQIYTSDGKLYSVISNRGSGPGEYIRIDDFCIDTGEKEVCILDGAVNKIIKYSFQGEFKAETNIPMSKGLSQFIMYKGQYYFDQKNRHNEKSESYNLMAMDLSGQLTVKEFPYTAYLDVVLAPRRSLFILNDTLVYCPLYDKTIYHVSPDGHLTPRYTLDFGEKWMNTEYLFNDRDNPISFIQGLKDTDGIYFLNLTESDSHLFLDFMYKDKNYYAVINKNNSIVNVGEDMAIDACKGKKAPLAVKGDFFVIPVERYNAPERFQEVGLMENNPILMVTKFK